MVHLCVVTEVQANNGGIQVRFNDLVTYGEPTYGFVRVLATRMSPRGGAALWYPEVGELGVAALTSGGFYIWLGSLPFLNQNQVDPTTGILYVRHESGTTIQIRPNGDTELLHCSGARLTMSQTAGQLPALQNSSNPIVQGDLGPPFIQLAHPSGALIQVDENGNGALSGLNSFQIQTMTGAEIQIDEWGNGTLANCTSFKFQNGSNQFVMDPFVTAFNDHTHTAPTGGGITSAPDTSVVKADVCSPTTFEGPLGP